MDNNTQKPSMVSLLLSAGYLGLCVGFSFSSWLERRNSRYEAKKRENRKLLERVSVYDANKALKLLDAEEKVRSAKYAFDEAQADLEKAKNESSV